MSTVKGQARQKVIGAAAVAVLVAGGAIAAVSATGQSSGRGAAHRVSGSTRLKSLFSARRRLGYAAASYLGVSPSELQRQLRAGKTLTQIVDARGGKSTAGLVAALAVAEANAPAARAADARLSEVERARREQRFKRRATRLVERNFAAAGRS